MIKKLKTSASSSKNQLHQENLKKFHPLLLDLMLKMLVLNPKKRITVSEMLEHPYMRDVRKIDDEAKWDKVVKWPICDDIKLSAKQYR